MSERRESVRRAIEESASAEDPAPRVRTPGPLHDLCATCREPIRVHDMAWRDMSTTWGLVIGANYCCAACEVEGHESAELVADELRARQTRG